MPKVQIDMTKAKAIAHEKRRAAREQEFAPLDEVIAKQILGTDLDAAEAERQAIRDKYDQVQLDIDAAQDPAQLRTVLDTAGVLA